MTNMRYGLLVNSGRPPSASSIKSMPPKILKFDILNFQQASEFASFYFPAKLPLICSAPTNKQTNKYFFSSAMANMLILFYLFCSGKMEDNLTGIFNLFDQDGNKVEIELKLD